jgi:hypothetical protein
VRRSTMASVFSLGQHDVVENEILSGTLIAWDFFLFGLGLGLEVISIETCCHHVVQVGPCS